MKIKFLALAMIAMLFTACKPDPQPEGGEGSDPNNGEVENSYIAVTLASADAFRDGEKFELGEDNERIVTSAHAFFFLNGEPFEIRTVNGDAYNYQAIPFTGEDGLTFTEQTSGNVSDISNSVLVIKNHKGELPNQMVVVLNWNPTEREYTLDALHEDIKVSTNYSNYFVMSNSVYKNVEGDVYATPLTINDFKNSRDEAMLDGAAVKVYVERVVAKVRFDQTSYSYPLKKKVGGSIEDYTINVTDDAGNKVAKQVYAEITGWELYNDYVESTLMKNIEGCPGVDATMNNFEWNNPLLYRSYWANTSNVTLAADDNILDIEESTVATKVKYCGENTNGNTEDLKANRTKVVFKAQLKTINEDNEKVNVEIARWYGYDYVGEENLLQAVANTLANTYYRKTTVEENGEQVEKYVSITGEDLVTVQGVVNAIANEYQVYFTLNGTKDNTNWYKRDGNNFTDIKAEVLNQDLVANLTPALLYDNGQTYYFTDIKHLGTSFGVVRNHIYDIKVNSITGLGTPIVGNDFVISTPVVPETDNETFVSAEINILSWRVVENNVDL